MKQAVFLDREGTVITLGDATGRLKDIKRMRLLPGVASAIRLLNKAGFVVIIHTNQTVVAWGQVSEKKLRHIHDVLCERLRKKGALVDAVYYCPHHPEAPLEKYRKVCQCRKPKAGMMLEALKKYQIKASQSFMIGDSSKDILAGKRAGLQTILVQTGNAGKERGAVAVEPNHVAKDLLAAAHYIKNKSASRKLRA